MRCTLSRTPCWLSERPAIVVRKTRLGDWEGDTVVSAGRKGGLLTLVERKTKLTKIAKLPRATARATQKAAVQDITHALKATIFFATPYSLRIRNCALPPPRHKPLTSRPF
jgi:IS30 family transposase